MARKIDAAVVQAREARTSYPRAAHDAAIQGETIVTTTRYLSGGYMLVETSSLERAIQIAKEWPMTAQPGASVEIRALAGRAQKISST